MISFSKSLKLSVIALLGVTLYAGAAPAPQRIDVKQMSKKVENVVVPLPNEIFGALNKLGSVNWANTSGPRKAVTSPNDRELHSCSAL